MGLTAKTAPGAEFSTREELLAHYRSEWHQFNLKRKAAGLPLLSRELFDSLKAQLSLSEAAPSSDKHDHLKPTPRAAHRRARKAKAQEAVVLEDDPHASGSDSDWEELSPEDAQHELASIERIEHSQQPPHPNESAAPQHSGAPTDNNDDDVERKVMEQLERNEGPVGLTSAGHELVVAHPDGSSKILGSRALAHMYRQRHHPVDARESTESARQSQVQRRRAAGPMNESNSPAPGTRPSKAALQEQHAKRKNRGGYKENSNRYCRKVNKNMKLPQHVTI